MVDQILQELERTGFSYRESLLDSESLSSINKYIDEHKSEFEAARVGQAGSQQRVESIRGDFTHWIDPLSPPEEFRKVIETLDAVRTGVNEKFFLGLKQYECHLAYYPAGTFYLKHLDRHEKDSTRRLSFVFYLNQEWQKEDGGELVLYDKQGNIIQTIYPMPGSFITFMSDEFPHEVKPALKERRSFTGWMHTKILY